MNNTCTAIEPLLYLFRDGELSAAEREEVAAHCRTCAKCAEVLAQLGGLEAGMQEYRSEPPRSSADARIVAGTLRRIEGSSGRETDRAGSRSSETIIAWLRPVLATLLIFATMTLVGQLSRDAVMVHRLETRLASADVPGGVTAAQERPDFYELLEIVRSLPGTESPFSSRSEDARMAAQEFGPALEDAMRRGGGLFDTFSAEYPRLSSITTRDGLDERERAILATEGKRFIMEFEQYVRKGELKL